MDGMKTAKSKIYYASHKEKTNMDKKLLKKLGNYFSKGVKVGALTTALLMGTGCDPLTKDNQETHQEIDYDQNLQSYIFLRHRFVEEGAKISYEDSDKTKLAFANRHFNDATAYMRDKIADLQRQIYENEPNGNFLQPICDEIFKDKDGNPDDGIEKFVTIDQILGLSDFKYSNLLAATIAKSEEEYYDFQPCYELLALRAYNDSLGYLKDSDKLPLNKEKSGMIVDLRYSGLTPNYNLIEDRLNQMLQNAADNTGVSVQTLQDVVNLSLLNASLWGARDLGATAGFELASYDELSRPAWDKLTRQELVQNTHINWKYYDLQYRREKEANQQHDQEQGL